jgi:imidazolonepropionase-like amidohydrolase
MFAANAILSTTGGHGDVHDVPLDWVERFGRAGGMLQVCDGVPEALKAVRTQLRMDAKVIKVCVSGGVLSEVDHPIHQQFRHDELRAIVEEAAMAERVVAAHCHGAPGIEAAIEAGVHTIEHGSYLTEDLAAGMVDNDMVLVPTRTIVNALVNHVFADGVSGGASPRMVEKAHLIAERHAQALGIAIDAGVTIAAGTDVGPSEVGHAAGWGRNAKELELLVEAGMTELQAIEAATATGPSTLGPQAPMAGELRQDWEADVLALSADPVADITALQDPASIVGVWQAGRRVVTGRDGVPELAPLPLLG